jgi:hypothetical protein
MLAWNFVERSQHGRICDPPPAQTQQELHPANAILVSWRPHHDNSFSFPPALVR